jgi:hypothetical protein
MANKFLWINCILFVLFGLGFILAPSALSNFVTGTEPGNTNAIIDMRATYGGMGLGVGLLFGYSALQRGAELFGVTASFLILSGIALGRIYGMAIGGSPNFFMFTQLAAELGFAAIAGKILLKKN